MRIHRPWFQFSLRAFLLLLTGGCVLLGWWVERARTQWRSVEAILRTGAWVLYGGDMEVEIAVVEHGVDHFWLDLFHPVTEVRLRGDEATDDICSEVARLPEIRNLGVCGTSITDVGLSRLAGLPKVEMLVLSRTAISDAGLSHVKRMQSLAYLGLSETEVTDAGLCNLTGLKRLDCIDLTATQVSSQALIDLRKSLPGCNIIDP